MGSMRKKENLALYLIFVFALFTRFWHYTELQFLHDEISALNRTGYHHFLTLLKKGVMVEGHPAGVQVFLHYYTQLVGQQPWLVKLPFALLGLASVALAFLCGKAMGKPVAGLLTAACMAVMQHFVMYSQLARPYGPGLFFSLLGGYFWILYIYKRPATKFLWGYMLAAAGAAYSHQFSLLLIGLMGISGFALLPKAFWKKYFFFNLGVFLLYTPHLPIFFHQLSLGGIGSWLAAPKPSFILDYFSYVAHYSWWFGGVLLLALVLTFSYKKPNFFWPGFIWFGLTVIIGYAYSVKVDAILQFSVLVFSFPFFLLFLFSAAAGARWFWLLPAVLLSGGLSLYWQRQHYPYFYISPFAKPIEAYKTAGPQAWLLHNLDPKKISFYSKKLAADTSRILYWPDLSQPPNFSALGLNGKTPVVLALTETAAKETPHFLAQNGFRTWQKKNYFGISLYRFNFGLKADSALWEKTGFPLKKDSTGMLYGAGYTVNLPDLKNAQDYYVAQTRIKTNSTIKNSEIASAIYWQDSLVYWHTSPLGPRQNKPIFTALHAFTIPKQWQHRQNLKLKLFIYNHDKVPMQVQLEKLCLWPGNKKVYGIVKPF
jgi:hypothetical protein